MANQKLDTNTDIFCDHVNSEVRRARKKFPGSNLSFLALVEEVGELGKALLKLSAAVQTGSDTMQREQNVYEEAVQVAAMACRVALEPDESLNVVLTNPNAM